MEENVHTVKILDLIISEDMKDVFIVINYFDKDLRTVLNQSHSLYMDEDHTKMLLFRLICALEFIHQANIIHRDIKPPNILVNDDFEILLCDFGLARTLPQLETAKKDYDREELA